MILRKRSSKIFFFILITRFEVEYNCIEKGIHEFCSYVNDVVIKDSAKIILVDSAVVILPDNFNLHLRGSTTSLIMNPGSKMMFGENSGIVCDNGAKVIANIIEIDAEREFKNSITG